MEKLMISAEVAELLHISPISLRRWRQLGEGPDFIRVGPKEGGVRYRPADVRRWIDERASAETKAPRRPTQGLPPEGESE